MRELIAGYLLWCAFVFGAAFGVIGLCQLLGDQARAKAAARQLRCRCHDCTQRRLALDEEAAQRLGPGSPFIAYATGKLSAYVGDEWHSCTYAITQHQIWIAAIDDATAVDVLLCSMREYPPQLASRADR